MPCFWAKMPFSINIKKGSINSGFEGGGEQCTQNMVRIYTPVSYTSFYPKNWPIWVYHTKTGGPKKPWMVPNIAPWFPLHREYVKSRPHCVRDLGPAPTCRNASAENGKTISLAHTKYIWEVLFPRLFCLTITPKKRLTKNKQYPCSFEHSKGT